MRDIPVGEVVLYDYWRSSASYRVRIGLALKEVDYRRVPVDLVKGEQRSERHLSLNPQGLVPALDIDGIRLTQSLAILEYLHETRPGPDLLPQDPSARAHARAVALAVACEIHPISNLGVLARVNALAGADARAAWNRDNIRTGLVAVEAMLEILGTSKGFCLGAMPTIADCALIPQLYNARRWEVAFDDLPLISAVEAAASTHPAFLAAIPENFASLASDKARA